MDSKIPAHEGVPLIPTTTVPTPVLLPARAASTRLPGKLLRPLTPGGPSVLEHTWGLAVAATEARAAPDPLAPPLVLAADERVAEHCRQRGIDHVLVDEPARNGSERLARWLERLPQLPAHAVNLQADAVGAPPGAIGAALEALLRCPSATLGTVAVRARRAERGGRTCVTAGPDGSAADFHRAPPAGDELLLHLGVYAYDVATLLRLAASAPTPRELALSLEQLRWIERGERVGLQILDGPPLLAHAVDRLSDLQWPP